MNFKKAELLLKTPIVKSFSKTKFPRTKLRQQSIQWAINLPSGPSTKEKIETLFHKTYLCSELRFGKPGKEADREEPNPWDMKPSLYEMRNGQLKLSEKGFEFIYLWDELKYKIETKKESGFVLMALLYRTGILLEHRYENNVFEYLPNQEIIRWLDSEFKEIGECPPSELLAICDAIFLNEDVKVYKNIDKYKSKDRFDHRGRINTMGAIFAVCAPDNILDRFILSDLFNKGRGTPRIFSKDFDYGGKIISPMTGGIIYSSNVNSNLLSVTPK